MVLGCSQIIKLVGHIVKLHYFKLILLAPLHQLIVSELKIASTILHMIIMFPFRNSTSIIVEFLLNFDNAILCYVLEDLSKLNGDVLF